MHSIRFRNSPVFRSYAAIGGQKEGEGHFGKYLDRIEPDPFFGKKNWEQSESALQTETFRLAVNKALLKPEELDCILAGDLIDQCTISSFAHRKTGVPFLGLYGACSTMAEALLLAGILTDGGYCERVCTVTSSHFSTAERQFRFPLSYGGQRTPTAQWTCTASGAAVVTARGEGVTLAGGCIGRICDLGVLLQVNAYDLCLNTSLATRNLAQWMAQERLISFIGSDMHGTRKGVRRPRMKEGVCWLYEHTDEEYANDVVRRNAEKLLGAQ